jgi:hypothetical protein
MSVVLADCKGHVHAFSSGPGGSRSGFYAVDPDIPSTGGGRCLLLGIPLALQEIVQPSVTLDDKRTLYVFGSAWNEASLTGVLLLGDSTTGGAQLQALLGWYEENRVSKKRGPVRLSLGPKGVDAYVTGLRLDAADPNFNKQMFSIMLLVSEP